MIVDCAIYRDGRRAETPSDLSDALEHARAVGDSFVWIGMNEPTAEEFDLLGSELGLHPLAVEDALKAHQRPKMESYTGALFTVVRPLTYDDAAARIHASELMVFIGESFVVTVRHGESRTAAEVRARMEQAPEVLRHGPVAVLYAIFDSVVDAYVDIATELQVDLEELEEQVFSPGGGGSGRVAGTIYTFKRQVLEFRRATGPLSEPMSRLVAGTAPYVTRETRPFFRDVADHLARANEAGDGLDRLLSDILGAHLTQVGVQQNDDMRKISAWAAMAVVPTAIAGIYGMNFEHMPELHQIWGYPAALGLMATLVLILYILFKRRGWF
ncbi:magnesium transporter [Streptomyces sp. DvalAA-14]|uniref:magnesium/cobalt transporter CorA n=1 Tax=unclassified Streptomyces TaxID=2593676 RepID=UPI00081B724E|nr:magnesium/cobalt transporter CorA [Streptomyces sp. DvalAA-14]MYS24879.1 magnesium/cobalt transporter CorA [Streptomyces sp. SID4948]SCE50230.1 magnesium transporter [Streptomyces sp. DvalAA-14]